VQADPIKPMLKASGTKRLKVKFDTLLSNFAFKINLRRYTKLAEDLAAMSARQEVMDRKVDDTLATMKRLERLLLAKAS